jgi:predicted RNase H-like nuclease
LGIKRNVKESNTIADVLSSHVTAFVSKIRNACSSSVFIKTPKTDSAGLHIPTSKMTIVDKDQQCLGQGPMNS